MKPLADFCVKFRPGRGPMVRFIVFDKVPQMQAWYRRNAENSRYCRMASRGWLARFTRMASGQRWILISLSRGGVGTVAHECFHAAWDWGVARGWRQITQKREERLAGIIDGLCRGYWNGFYRLKLDRIRNCAKP